MVEIKLNAFLRVFGFPIAVSTASPIRVIHFSHNLPRRLNMNALRMHRITFSIQCARDPKKGEKKFCWNRSYSYHCPADGLDLDAEQPTDRSIVEWYNYVAINYVLSLVFVNERRKGDSRRPRISSSHHRHDVAQKK